MGDYLTDIVSKSEAKTVGKTLLEAPLVHDLDIAVIGVYRDKMSLIVPLPQLILQGNDNVAGSLQC